MDHMSRDGGMSGWGGGEMSGGGEKMSGGGGKMSGERGSVLSPVVSEWLDVAANMSSGHTWTNILTPIYRYN